MNKLLPIVLLLFIESGFILNSFSENETTKPLNQLVNDGSWEASSSSQDDDMDPGKAVDGNSNSRWSSSFEDNQWLSIDLGREEFIGRIRILWEDAYAADFNVLVSTDGESWSEVSKQTGFGGGESWITFPPRQVRYIKVDCLRRATKWGFSIFEIEINPFSVSIDETAALTGDGDYAAEFAVDGNRGTRWSSGFNDADWWQVKFTEPTIISGLVISWETAFSEKYEIALSDDGKQWQTVYKVKEGDGQTDILFFKPTKTRYLRIVCNQRGTGWGNSIWEIRFFGAVQAPTLSASSSLSNIMPELAFDGDPSTAWHSLGTDTDEDEGTDTEWLELMLPEKMRIGGLDLLWGDDFATEYSIETLGSDGGWTQVYSEMNGNGGRDYAFFPATATKGLRVVCKKGQTPNGFSIAQMELKSGEEQATPLRDYQAKALNDRPGMFPMWLSRQQEFWTVVGVPNDNEESLLGETGVFEPFKGAFSVQPFIIEKGQIRNWADVKLEQSLEDEDLPIPTVRWISDSWVLEIAAVAGGAPGETVTVIRYRLINKGTDPFSGQLALAVRPVQLNPIWQHGGMSPIHKAEVGAAKKAANLPSMTVNDRIGMVFSQPPVAAGCAALKDGDPIDFFARGEVPPQAMAEDKDGKTGAGLLFDLDVPPGESRDVLALYPLHGKLPVAKMFADDAAGFFDSGLAAQRAMWRQQLDRIEIEIPETRLIKVMKSNLAYVLINRDTPWFKPGSRNYNHSWMRDGALTGVAMLRMGHPELPGEFIKAFTVFIRENGWVPYMILENGQPIGSDPYAIGGEGQEYDSQGQYAFIVRQYVDYTDDTKLLKSVYPKVAKALRLAYDLRRHRMTDEYRNAPDKKDYFGVLPLSNSHEGYYPAKHSYWDDFWYIRGLQDGAALATRMGREDDAAWMQTEEKEAREDLYTSMLAVGRRHGLQVLPGCVELGDVDPTSTTIAIMAADELSMLPQPQALNTFELYYSNVTRRLSGIADTFTPYEARNIDVFVRLGWRERALRLLRFFLEDSTRPRNWNHLAEVVHAKPRAPSYIGDMPHTWVGSDLINAIRSFFAYEHDNRLFLAAGIDPAWAAEGISVSRLPTSYGVVNYTIRDERDAIRCHFDGSAQPPQGFVFPLPQEWQSYTITLDGNRISPVKGMVVFPGLPCEIDLSPEN